MSALQDRAFPGHFDQRCPSFLVIEILTHRQSVQLGHLFSIHAATCLTQTLDQTMSRMVKPNVAGVDKFIYYLLGRICSYNWIN